MVPNIVSQLRSILSNNFPRLLEHQLLNGWNFLSHATTSSRETSNYPTDWTWNKGQGIEKKNKTEDRKWGENVLLLNWNKMSQKYTETVVEKAHLSPPPTWCHQRETICRHLGETWRIDLGCGLGKGKAWRCKCGIYIHPLTQKHWCPLLPTGLSTRRQDGAACQSQLQDNMTNVTWGGDRKEDISTQRHSELQIRCLVE